MNKGVKKAQGLSLNTIAIAAIVIIVLIVVIFIFKGGINKIWPSISGANDCKEDLTNKDKQFGCMAAGKCSSGTEVYGLGCEAKDIDSSKKQSKTPYCCIKNQNG